MKHLLKCTWCQATLTNHASEYSRCIRCGLVFRNPFPDKSDLDTLYIDDNLSAMNSLTAQTYANCLRHTPRTGGINLLTARTYADCLRRTLGLSNLVDLSIVDYGAGRGDFAIALAELGANSLAIDPYMVAKLQEKGINAYNSIDDLPKQTRINGFVAMDVMEHLPQPWNELRHMYERLAPGGWVCVCTPNVAGIRAKVQGDKWSQFYPEHIVLMGRKQLYSLMSSAGFEGVHNLKWSGSLPEPLHRRIYHILAHTFLIHGHVQMIGFKRA